MAIQVGERAPHYAVEAYVRGTVGPQGVSLAGERGRWVVLFFYPRDFTFVCPTELQEIARLQGEFERLGAAVLAASTDSFYVHRAWFTSEPRLAGVRYPVIADTTHGLAEEFGVLLEDGASLRATFIIDPEGVVRHQSVSDHSVGRNIGEVLRVLEALQTGELCPVGWVPGEPTLLAS